MGLKKILKRMRRKSMPLKDKNGVVLEEAQVCLVDNGSWAPKPYYVGVVVCDGVLHTFIPNGWKATIHDYWCKEIEVIGNINSHGHLLFGQKIYTGD